MQQLMWRMLAAVMLSLTSIATAQESVCLEGQLDGRTSFVRYCYNGEWRLICNHDSDWNQQRTNDACTQLGYTFEQNESGTSNDVSITTTPRLRVVTVTNCIGPGLTQCTVTPSGNCTTCSHVHLDCTTGRSSCLTGSLRLVGGSTEREGRVEVCVRNRWRTVCTDNSQQLAGAVCSLLGYIFEGGAVSAVDTFPIGALPEYRLDCLRTPTGVLTCQPIMEQCSSPVELGVVCKNYDDLCNECSMESTSIAQTTPPNSVPATTDTDSSATDGSATGSSLIAGIAVLVVLLVAVVVGWTVSCIILLRRQTGQQQQNHTPGTTLGDTNEHLNETRIDEHTYDAATAMSGDSYSKLNRGPAQSDMIADVTYAEPDQIRGPSPERKKPPKITPYQPDHPPPVGGVSEDHFYNAEVHTYAAVDKKKASLGTP